MWKKSVNNTNNANKVKDIISVLCIILCMLLSSNHMRITAENTIFTLSL